MALNLKGWWPDIVDAESARKAAKNGWQTAFFVAGTTTIVSVLSIVQERPIAGIDGWSLCDAALAAIIGWRVMRMSKAWAIVGLCYWILNLGSTIATGTRNSPIGIVSILLLFGFISGVRGTFAYHQYLVTKHRGEAASL